MDEQLQRVQLGARHRFWRQIGKCFLIVLSCLFMIFWGAGNAIAKRFKKRAAEQLMYKSWYWHSSQGIDREVLNFLAETLQLVAVSGGNSEQVYPFIVLTQKQLNEVMLQALPFAFNRWIDARNLHQQRFIAKTFVDFADLIQEFPLGQRALNLEGAIQAYELALQVFTRTRSPWQWVLIQNNLAIAVRERIQGNQAENLERAIHICQQTLQICTRTRFPTQWALLQINLALAYSDQIWGDRAENLEGAIQAYELALQVFTRTRSPWQWAMTQMNLGIAYFNRIRGDRAENLEWAIQTCEWALEVITPFNVPVQWATIQMNLATAYSDRIRGDRAENLEWAIQAYNQALQIFTRADFPTRWAAVKTNLAIVLRDRIRGDRAENLEWAIQAYKQALQIFTRDDFPREWARTQNSLAITFKERIRGDRAENLEWAIEDFAQVLQVYTRTNFPMQWAMTLNSLANAFVDRVGGDRAENLERAIQAYEQVLQVFTCTNFPMQWAMTQNNLATALESRIRGDQAQNLELAIQAYELSLQVFTCTNFPMQWAMTQNNLATTLKSRIRGDQAENLELAIQACKQALEIYTRNDFPVQWAGAQYNLALVYSDRIRGDHAENLKQALASYYNALEIYQPEAFPLECLRASRNLGNLHFRDRNWTAAVAAYELALQGLDQARNWALTDDRRQELQVEAASVYTNLIQSYVHLERYGRALEIVERSRSQRLVHLMASQDYYAQAGISPELQTLLTRYDSLQTQINQLQRQQATLAQTCGRAALSADSEEIHALEVQKQTLRQQISRLDPVSAGIIQVSPIDLATLQTLIPRPECALLSFYITETDTHIFILKQTHITCHTCPNQGDALRKWLFETWLKPYAEINLAATKHDRIQRRQAWITQMPDILRELVERLNLPELIQTHLQDIEDLILVPHLLLHQIPFAALPLESGYLSDRFTLRQVPSTQILKFCHDRPPLQPTAYGTVEDATDDLPCSSFEGDQIAHLYNIPTTQRLRGSQQATVPNYLKLLPQVQTLLSSHHAHSRLDNPLESSLQLGDGCITLGNLISPAIRMPDLADIFLSCCETGLSPNLGQSDEPLSLASGFLYAGARNVVSTLWAVDDLATAIFSIRYHHHRQSHNRPFALKHAQTDLRTMTGTHLKQQYAAAINVSLEERYEQVYAKVKAAQAARDQCDRDSENYAQLEEAYEFWRTIQKRIDQAQQQLKQLCRADHPFEHPVFWSGFVCQGLE